jgi:hypothetical protein
MAWSLEARHSVRARETQPMASPRGVSRWSALSALHTAASDARAAQGRVIVGLGGGGLVGWWVNGSLGRWVGGLVDWWIGGLGAGRGRVGHGGATVRVAAAPKQQTVLGARGEHAVRLCRAAGHQVVDQHANVGLVPPEHKGRLPITSRERRVEAGDEAKARRLLVAGGADDLPRQIEAAARLGVVRQPHARRPLWPARACPCLGLSIRL